MRDWTRVIWANPGARAVWEPRIHAIQQAWFDVEVRSVVEGLRPAGLVFGRPAACEQGLPFTPVADDRYAIGPAAGDLAAAFWARDDETVGQLLGYPACCRAFFGRTWAQGLLDTTGQMAGAIDGQADGPVACNILGRWLGVRFVMHLPCSWTCDATTRLAARYRDLWPFEALVWAEQVLSWPMQWSARHGIAEVVFPVCKLSTRTTPGETATVRRSGLPPPEAATGVRFPFTQPRRALQLQVHDREALANGFNSRASMAVAHEMVLAALATSPPHGLTVDLGCGSGRLLRQIARQFDVQAIGVEADPSRAQGAADILVTDLSALDSLPDEADTFVVSLRRFEEIPALEPWVKAHARQVVVYSYDPPMFARVA